MVPFLPWKICKDISAGAYERDVCGGTLWIQPTVKIGAVEVAAIGADLVDLCVLVQRDRGYCIALIFMLSWG